MANHKSAIKRIRSNETKRLRNRYQLKTTRTFIKKIKNENDLTKVSELLKITISKLDKLTKKNIIHKNKASNLKSKLSKYIKLLEDKNKLNSKSQEGGLNAPKTINDKVDKGKIKKNNISNSQTKEDKVSQKKDSENKK